MYQTKSSIDKDEFKSKLEETDLSTIQQVVQETETWLLDEERTKTDYDNKLNELNGQLQPIMMKAMGQQGFPGSEGFPGSKGLSTNEAVPPSTDGENSGPTIDEVD